MKRTLTLLLFLLPIFTCAAPKADPAALPFLEGLDALESGDYPAATQSFSAAIEADSDNPLYRIARAVSYMLAEKFDPAEKDLLRAQKQDQTRRDTRLWLAGLYNMRGDFMKSSATYPAATRDQYENLVSDVTREYGQLPFRQNQQDEEQYLKEPRQQHAVAIARFKEVAAAFSQRYKSSIPDIAPLLYERAQAQMAKKDWVGALRSLEQARQTRPRDAAILNFIAFCDVYLGAPAGAREQFTAVLTANPTWASSFAGRAMAAAVMGDARRAQTDLNHAIALNPAEAERYKGMVEAVLKASPPPQVKREDLSGLVQNLYTAARSSASDDDLIKQATIIIKGMHAYRLRADETYFDRRCELEEKAKSNEPEALANLAQFLYEQAHINHTEKVETRAEPKPYRPTDTEGESAYALQCCEKVLATNPNHVKALTYKASVLMDRNRWGDAENLLKKASAVDPSYGPLLQAYARLLNWCAWTRYCKAADLRTVKLIGEDAQYYYYHRPSEAELAEADRLQAEADRIAAWARQQLETAAKNYAGKALGYYYTAILANHLGQREQARTALEEAVKLDPSFEAGWDDLAEQYHMAGMVAESAEAKSRAVNLTHTTAGHMLRYAWTMIEKTKFKAAGDALKRAIDFDPADPRTCAYLGAIALGDERPAEGLAWLRAASAMEEARAALFGTSIRSAGAATLTAEGVGFGMSLNNRLGRLALAQSNWPVAIEAFGRNIGLEKRIAKSEYFTPIPSTMMPDEESGDAFPRPEAEIPVSLFMWAHEGTGEALLKLGKDKEAIAQFQFAMGLPKLRHPTMNAGNRMGDPFLLCKINLVKYYMRKNDLDTAWKVMTSSGEQPGGSSRELQDQIIRLNQELTDRRSKRETDDWDKQQQEMRARQQAEIEKYRKQSEEYDARRRAELERIRRQQQDQDRRRRGQ